MSFTENPMIVVHPPTNEPPLLSEEDGAGGMSFSSLSSPSSSSSSSTSSPSKSSPKIAHISKKMGSYFTENKRKNDKVKLSSDLALVKSRALSKSCSGLSFGEYCATLLPSFTDVSAPQFPLVRAETVVQLINNGFPNISKYFILDCRYTYEYDGGHIIGSYRIATDDDLKRLFFHKPLLNESVAILIHCEFSSKRGPDTYDMMRKLDRVANMENYPRLFYPDLYLIEGGYYNFFQKFPQYCTPQDYVSMFDRRFIEDCKKQMGESKRRKFSSPPKPIHSNSAILLSLLPPPTNTDSKMNDCHSPSPPLNHANTNTPEETTQDTTEKCNDFVFIGKKATSRGRSILSSSASLPSARSKTLFNLFQSVADSESSSLPSPPHLSPQPSDQQGTNMIELFPLIQNATQNTDPTAFDQRNTPTNQPLENHINNPSHSLLRSAPSGSLPSSSLLDKTSQSVRKTNPLKIPSKCYRALLDQQHRNSD